MRRDTMKPLLALLLGLAVLGGGPAGAADLTVGIGNPDLGKLDPHLAAPNADRMIISSIFSGLVRYQPGTASVEAIEPDLAESWTRSPDGKAWEFKLRHGVKWHHGFGEFTADDVVFSLKRAATKSSSAFSSDYAELDKVEAVDPYTVRITLKQPVPSLLGLVANSLGGNIVSRKAAEQLGKDYALKPIGTGPFMFDSYKPQQSVVLVANPDYFRGKPKIDRITYRFVQSEGTRDLALRAGELDLVEGRLSKDWIDFARKLPGVSVDVFGHPEQWWLFPNRMTKPLDDIRVRQAIAHAVDRTTLAKFRGETTQKEATSVIPKSYAGYTPDVGLLPYDPAKAKALLAAAGYPNGLTLKVINSNRVTLREIIEVLQGQMRASGINLDIELVDHAAYHARIREDQSQLVLYGASRFPVADVLLTQFFHSRSSPGTPTAVTNFGHCNVADAEIDAARTEVDPAKQKALWQTAQQKIVKDICAVPLLEVLFSWARRSTVDLGYSVFTDSPTGGPMITEKTQVRK